MKAKRPFKVNKFIFLVILGSLGVLSMGASSWLIINEQSGSPSFQSKNQITASITISGTAYEGMSGLTINSNIPGTLYHGLTPLIEVSAGESGRDVSIPKAPINLSGTVTPSERDIVSDVVFYPSDEWLKNNEILNETALNLKIKVRTVVWDGGSTGYTSIDYALNQAKSGNLFIFESLTTFRQFKNYTSATIKATELNEYKNLAPLKIREDQEIPSNVTLIIPCSDNVSDESKYLFDITSALASSNNAYSNSLNYLKYNISIDSGYSLTNNGNLYIGGIIGGGKSGMASLTASNYGQLTIGQNSVLTNKMAIKCFGFIDEESRGNDAKVINAQGATITMPFTIYENRGMSTFGALANLSSSDITSAMWGKTVKAKYNVCPFTRFFFGNVMPEIECDSGAFIVGTACLNLDSKIEPAYINIVGNTDNYLLNIPSGTIFTCKYIPEDKNSKWDVYGNINFNYLNVTLAMNVMSTDVKAQISTESIFFPISCLYDISFHKYTDGNSATVNINQDIKILPGGTFNIDQGVSVVAKKIIVYDRDYLEDPTKNYGLNAYANHRSSTNPDGMLMINGNVSCTSFGGVASTSKTGAKLVFTSNQVQAREIVNNEDDSCTWDMYGTGNQCHKGLSQMSSGTYYSKVNQWYSNGTKSITYDTNGGAAVPSQTFEVNSFNGVGYPLVLGNLPTTTKDYYTIEGWYYDGLLTDKAKVNDQLMGDLTLYANWSPKVYTVVYVYGTGMPNKIESNLLYSTALGATSLPSAEDSSGRNFAGWYLDEDFSLPVNLYNIAFLNANENNEVTVYAKWQSGYTVNFEIDNGESSTVIESISFESYEDIANTTIQFPGALAETTHKKFISWNVEINGVKYTVSDWSFITEAVSSYTVYAQWQDIYYIEFVTQNSEVSTIDTVKLYEDLANDTTSYNPYAEEENSPYRKMIANNNDITKQKYFTGWFDAATAGNRYDGEITIDSDITLYAQWANKWQILVNYSHDSAAKQGKDAIYKFSLKDENENVYINAEQKENEALQAYVMPGHFFKLELIECHPNPAPSFPADWTEVNDNFTYAIQSSTGVCVAEGTLVTLADGTQKPVEQLTYADEVLVFNHETGTIEKGNIAMLDHLDFEREWHNVINLKFSNGNVLRTVWNHGLFNVTRNKYVFIHEGNYNDYIGDEFYSIKYVNGEFVNEIVKLTESYITNEFIKVYNPTTAIHMNYFASGMLNVTALPNEYLDCWHVNIFEYDENMKIDESKKQADIEKYGLYTYEDFKEYLTMEQFNALPFNYLKVAVGKGRLTWEDIIELIEYFKINNLI